MNSCLQLGVACFLCGVLLTMLFVMAVGKNGGPKVPPPDERR